jgi:micrococcal nuclease
MTAVSHPVQPSTDPRASEQGAKAVRRLVWRKRLIVVGVLGAIALLIVADQRGWLFARHQDDLACYHGMRAKIIRIIDGDTIEVDLPDTLTAKPATRVRLWGVNAPEPASGNRPAESFANPAIDFLTQKLHGQTVTLWLETHQTRDTFGAVLAHLELLDGTRANEAMLEAGLARVDERWPHAMLTRYAQIENSARRRGAGLWTSAKPSS